MSTVKLFCPQKLLSDVMADMMKSNVRYWPIRRHLEWANNSGTVGYIVEMEANHPVVSFLVLKHGLKQIE